MKNKIKHISALFLGGIIGLTACTDSFESFNTLESGFSDESKKQEFNYYAIPLGTVQQGIYFNYDWGKGKNWTFQTMQNLGADMFSGFVHDFNPFNDGRSNTTYNMMDGWNGSTWDNTYGYIMPEVQKSEDINKSLNPGFYGITKIIKVELMHRLADLYGPIIYTQFGSKTGSMPDTQKEAYAAFFKDLDEGIVKIREYMAIAPNVNNFEKFDILMPKGKKTYSEWIKFANSLRLRLAVRIAMANPTQALEEAQKALTDKEGVLEGSDEIVAVSTEKGYTNPFGEINLGWNEVFMNANMESFLIGYKDPRLEKYFKPSSLKGAPGVIPYEGTYKGIRQGTGFSHKNYIGHSPSTISQESNAVLMTAAEVWFLRAEAALRGWSNEVVKECYEKGVKASFAQWRAEGVESYLQNTNKPADYTDAFTPANNIKAVNTLSPKWNDAGTNEEKLAQIITQKWLAIYPEGGEAWAEQRRTGYPKLFPVMINDSKGTIDANIGPRRLNFYVGIKTANPEQYSALVTALGGVDNCGMRLWWDTGRNF